MAQALDRLMSVFSSRGSEKELEVRKPQAATQRTGLWSPYTSQTYAWDADAAIQRAYYGNIFVYSGVQTIATALSRLPFRAGADPERPTSYNVNAPLAKLLGPARSANPEFTSRGLLANAVANYLVTGRFAWEIEYSRSGQPLYLWPLVTSNLEVETDDGGERYFKGFKYRAAGVMTGKVPLTRDEVVYGWRPALDDPRQPESVLQAAGLNISVAIMLDKYNFAFLNNGAVPAAAVVTPEFENDEKRAAFQRQFLGRHQGPDNAGNVAFVEGNTEDGGASGILDVKTLGLSQRDMQAAQLYRSELQAITVALGVPMSMLGDASGRTFDNAGAEAEMFWQQTMLPLIHDFQDILNRELAPKMGSDVGWFDLTKVKALQPRRSLQPIDLPTLRKQGDISLNEERAMLDLPPIEGGEVYGLEPEELSLADKVAALDILIKDGFEPTAALEAVGLPPIEHTGAVPFNSPDNPPAEEKAAGEPEATEEASAGEVQERHAGPHGPHKAEDHEAVHDPRDAHVIALQMGMTQSIVALFERQRATSVIRLMGKRGRQALERRDSEGSAVFDPAFWHNETADHVAPMYHMAAALASVEASGDEVAAFVRGRSHDLAERLTGQTHRSIAVALGAGIAGGETPEQVAERINAVFDTAVAQRAPAVAVEEAVTAYDEAVAVTKGVKRETLTALLLRLSTGELDLDAAKEQLAIPARKDIR